MLCRTGCVEIGVSVRAMLGATVRRVRRGSASEGIPVIFADRVRAVVFAWALGDVGAHACVTNSEYARGKFAPICWESYRSRIARMIWHMLELIGL